MSSVIWSGNQLIQRCRDQTEILGFIESAEDTGTYSFWVKNIHVQSEDGGYFINGGSFSPEDVKRKVLDSPVTQVMHALWLAQIGQPTQHRVEPISPELETIREAIVNAKKELIDEIQESSGNVNKLIKIGGVKSLIYGIVISAFFFVLGYVAG